MNCIRWPRLVLSAVAVSSLGGCASWSKPVAKTEAMDTKAAYFYGSFLIDSEHSALSFDGYSTMGFEFLCSDQKRYTFRFNMKADGPFQVIKVKPANCSMRWIIFTDSDGSIKSSHDVPATLFHDIDVKPGTAYYFGNFEAQVINTSYGTYFETRWHMKSMLDLFRLDTEELKKEYPGLTDITTVDPAASAKGNASQFDTLPPSTSH